MVCNSSWDYWSQNADRLHWQRLLPSLTWCHRACAGCSRDESNADDERFEGVHLGVWDRHEWNGLPQRNTSGPLAIVMGNEGKGVSQNVKESGRNGDDSDGGTQTSLNASVASALMMYEVFRKLFVSRKRGMHIEKANPILLMATIWLVLTGIGGIKEARWLREREGFTHCSGARKRTKTRCA